MIITDPGALLPLTAVYVTTTSAVLLCEVVDELKADIKHWKIYLDGELEGVYTNEDSYVEISHLYARLFNLDREKEYTAYVIAVDNSDTESLPSNTVTFTTFPKF